jgi:transcription regulator MmyB-like protein
MESIHFCGVGHHREIGTAAAGPRGAEESVHDPGQAPALNELVGELSIASPQFAQRWADHTIFQHTHGPKTVHHYLVGDLELQYQSPLLPQDPDW